MKLLLDHCVPHSFSQLLPEHEVFAASQLGWQDSSNGELMRLAKADGFQAFITVDQNLRYQQNLSELPLSVLIIETADTRIQGLRPLLPAVRQGVAMIERATHLPVVVIAGASGARV